MFQQFVLNGLIAGSNYALVAIGFSLIYSTVRFFNFAHGAMYTVGAYIVFALSVLIGIPLWFACLISIFITSILGVVIHSFIYLPLRNKKASPLILLIVSLGIFIVFQNIISIFFGNDTKTIRSGVIHEGINVFNARITPVQIIVILISIILFIFLSVILYKTKMGKAIRAVANDSGLAEALGLPSEKIINFVFFLSSGLASFAAILISFDIDITPSMGFNALLMGVIAAIIGGIGSIPGAYVGGIFLGIVQHLGVWKLPSKWQDAIAFALLFIFLIFRPQGFFGKKTKKVEV